MRKLTRLSVRERWAVLSAVLLGIAAVLLSLVISPSAARTAPIAADARLDVVPPSPSPLARAIPVSLAAAKIGLVTDLDRIGTKPDGDIADPAGFARASWFAPGPSPGESGSSVIIGHVDDYRGPAVFFRLSSLALGDEIQVNRSDGTTASFAVYRTQTVPKEQFPADQVYRGGGPSDLALVTCGGAFDTATRGYRSNVIVYTRLIDRP
ncbi:sortase domain-bontaining protein [Nocardia sp. NPDC058058]|uniref:sortase domain-containing protein n=1 Tax=Nocardia sp. NPDC058058 TaxID=3346317 RepID=UPI0036D99F8B